MTDSGEMELMSGGAVRFGELPPESGEQGALILSEGGKLDSSKVRRSERKKSVRPISACGRLAKSRPKSSLLRMAEMRKGGLRGRALRHSGMKGLEGSDLKANKGMKGLVGRGLQVLVTISECNEASVGLVEGLGVEGNAGGGDGVSDGYGVVMAEDWSAADLGASIVLGSPSRRPEEGCPKPTKLIPDGIQSDLALDLMSTKPLQEMAFTREQVIPAAEMGDSGTDCLMLKLSQVEVNGRNMQANDCVLGTATDEEFSPLSKDNLRFARDKERNRGVGGREVPRVTEQPAKGNLDKNKGGKNGGQSPKVDGNNWFGVKNYKATLADGVNTRGNLPVSF